MKLFFSPLTFLLVLALLLAACGGDAPTPTAAPAPTVAAVQNPTPVQNDAPVLNEAATRGEQLFTSPPANCSTCHSLQPDVRIIGPSLAQVAIRAASRVPGQDARQYLENSILKPADYVVEGYPNVMLADLAKQLTSDEINDLVEYMLTLK